MLKDTELVYRFAVYIALVALTGTLGWVLMAVAERPVIL